MDKIEVFCDYYRNYAGDMYDSWSNEAFYPVAIARLARQLYTITELTEEALQEEIEFVLFWALYGYGKYDVRKEEPILDVEVKDLPIHMEPKELERFKGALEIVIDHHNSVSWGIGKPPLLTMAHFEPFLTRREKFTMEIPAIWLNT